MYNETPGLPPAPDVWERTGGYGRSVYVAHVQWPGSYAEPRYAEIEYRRNDRAEFEATYRQICENFRVIREK